jgi:RHS repeat-associated protein
MMQWSSFVDSFELITAKRRTPLCREKSQDVHMGWMRAILLVSMIVLTNSVLVFAQSAPICDNQCGPDPGSGSYQANIGSRPKLNNARGRSNRRAPHVPILGAGQLSGTTEAVPGSQSYNWSQGLISLPGRAGLDLNLVLSYNSRVWDVNTSNNQATFNIDRDFPSYGFRLDFGYLENDTTDGFWILTEADDGKHQISGTGTTLNSIDSTYIQLNIASASAPVITYANGLKVLYQQFPHSTTLFRPTQITDTNGNFISISYRSGSTDVVSDQQINTITDTLGRVLNYNYTANSSGALQLHTITQTINAATFTWATFTWGTVALNYNFATGFTASTDTPANGTVINVLTSCTLPNGTYYSFSYGDWGIVNEIDYFSKTNIKRSYQKYNFPLAASGALSDVPTFTQETISPDGTTTNNWTFATTSSNDIVSQQSITDPTGTVIMLNLLPSTDNCAGAVSSTTVALGSTTLRTMTDTWQQDSAGNCQLTAMRTTLNDSGQVTGTDYIYDTNGNLTIQRDYDFGPGAIGPKLREIQTGYVPPTSNHILNLVNSVVVGDTTGTFSNTGFSYDGSQPSALPGTGTLVQNSQPPSGTARGNLTSITRYQNAQTPSGPIVRNFTYDITGNLVTADADCCSQKKWFYSSATQWAYPDSVQRGSGTTTLTTSATYYFDTGQVHTATDENQQQTTLIYDTATRRLIETDLPSLTKLYRQYDDSALQPTVTSSNNINNRVQVSVVDGLGRLVQQQNRSGTVTSSTVISTVDTAYDSLGRTTSVSNPYAPGDTEVYTSTIYDHLSRATQVSPPSGGSYLASYSGNAVTSTDPASKQIRHFSDGLGRLTEVDEPGFGSLPGKGTITINGSEQSKIFTTRYCAQFDLRGRCVDWEFDTTTDYDSGTVAITVNGFTKSVSYGQNDTSATIAANLAQSFNIDSSSPVTATSSSNTLTLTSKATGVSSNYTLSSSVTYDTSIFTAPSFSVSAPGNLTGGTDPAVTLLTPAVTTYDYRPTGELRHVYSGAQTRTYNYDDMGRLTSTTLPESGTWSYVYFDFGGMQTRTDARGVITSYTYDGLNRLATMSYNVGTTGVQNPGTVTFNYGTTAANNNNGRLISMVDGSGEEDYTYNIMGWVTQLTKKISGTNYVIGYAYDGLGNLTDVTYPSTHVVHQSYDSIGRLSGITNQGANALTVGSYNATGQVLGATYGNGVTSTFTYNDHLQVSRIIYTGAGATAGQTLLDLTYAYGTNNNGQIASITDARGAAYNQQFSYDALGRLMNGQTGNLTGANTWCLNWNYDRYGNRFSQSGCGGTLTVGQPNLSVSTTSNRITSTGYNYDANGNLTADPSHAYAYDADNRMVTVDAGGASPHSYSYDGNRLRIIKDSTVYVYSGTKVIAEYSGGSLQKEYVYSGGKLLATVVGSSTIYHHPDHLSNRVETDGSGNVVRTFGQVPFGETWYETGTADKWKFTSYERDSETTLDYAISRYYANGLGCFASPDVLQGDIANPQSLNRYSYVLGDPVNLVDPLGLFGTNCALNINVNNKAGLSSDEVTAIEKRINEIFGATTDPDGNTVSASFVDSGGDYTLNFSSDAPKSKDGDQLTVLGVTVRDPTVYIGTIKTEGYGSAWLLAAGTTGAHELTHQLAGGLNSYGDQKYNGDPNLMNWDSAVHQNKPGTPFNSNTASPPQGFSKLTPQQVAKMFKNCIKKQKKRDNGGGGGGIDDTILPVPHTGGGGGGGGPDHETEGGGALSLILFVLAAGGVQTFARKRRK